MLEINPGKWTKLGICIFACSLITIYSSPLYSQSKEEGNKLTFAHLEWKPYTYTDANGQSVGIFVDVMKEIFEKRLSIKVVARNRPWKRAQLEVRDGDADVIITVPTQERLDYAQKSKSVVFPLYQSLFTYNNHPKLIEIQNIKTIEDILRLKLKAVSNLGNSWHKKNIQMLGVPTKLVSEDEKMIKILAHQRADILIDETIAINISINENGLNDKIVQTTVRYGPANFHLLMSKKSKFIKLMPKIDQIIFSLVEDGTFSKIPARYGVN